MFYLALRMPALAKNISFSIADRMNAREMNLPSYADLFNVAVEGICEQIKALIEYDTKSLSNP